MLVDSSNSAAGPAVTSAIREASQATGTSFNYLLATAQVESGLNPHAGAPTSSARGLFQFIDTTWLATIKQYGGELGYGRYADAISVDGSGRYTVADPAMRSEILKLRNDPTANAVMAGAFTRTNATALTERLGRAPSEGELYIAHFLGAGGAARLIALAATNPNAKAADFFPNAAQANSSIFYDRSGAARSLAQVRNVLTARYDVARGSQDGANFAAQAAAVAAGAGGNAAASSAPDTAGIANAFAAAIPTPKAADKPPVFNSLFTDGGRSAPVAPMVSALWSVPNAAASSAGTAAQKSAANGMVDLFKDLPLKDLPLKDLPPQAGT
jgi:hypothetical protein